MFLIGRDVLDPTIPSSYCLELRDRDRWHLQVLDARYAAKSASAAVNAARPDGPTWLVLAEPPSQGLSPPVAMIEDGLRNLSFMQALKVVFVDDWPRSERIDHSDKQSQATAAIPRATSAFAMGRKFGAFLQGLRRGSR